MVIYTRQDRQAKIHAKNLLSLFLSLSKMLSPVGWQTPPTGEQTKISAPHGAF